MRVLHSGNSSSYKNLSFGSIYFAIYSQPRILRLLVVFLYYGEVGNVFLNIRDRFLQMCMPYVAYGDVLWGGLYLFEDFGYVAYILERDMHFMSGSLSP